MGQSDDDEISELPADALEKRRFLLQLSLERAKSQVSTPGSAASKFAEAVRNVVEEMGELRGPRFPIVPRGNFKASPFAEAVSKANKTLHARSERQQIWREEWEAGQVEASVSSPAVAAPSPVAARKRAIASPEVIQQLAQRRKKLLADYKAATGHSSLAIYLKGTKSKLHTCHKQKFHLWQKGELPADSAPATSLERFLKELRPIVGADSRKRKKKG